MILQSPHLNLTMHNLILSHTPGRIPRTDSPVQIIFPIYYCNLTIDRFSTMNKLIKLITQ